MIENYNNDQNIYAFLMDEDSKRILVESMLDGERMRGEKRGVEKTRLQTAKSLLKDNVSLKIIKNATGYSEEYLKNLKI